MEKRRREQLRDWVLGQRGSGVILTSAEVMELLNYIDELEAQRV